MVGGKAIPQACSNLFVGGVRGGAGWRLLADLLYNKQKDNDAVGGGVLW